MKKITCLSVLLLIVVHLFVIIQPHVAQATDTGDVNVMFQGLVDPGVGIQDPENPKVELLFEDDYGKTTGPLRIDFVPNISFSSNKISTNDISYASDALLFKDVIAPRGYFIQVSDYREKQTGWNLQVRQEIQFTDQDNINSQLDGAVLSFDKSSISTLNGANQHPTVSKEVIRLNNIGETYTLAEAEKGISGGTWSIAFGASQDNPNGDSPTINSRLDSEGKPMIDPKNNQAIYMNDAVRLSLPGGAKTKPGTYTTVLTWIISELP